MRSKESWEAANIYAYDLMLWVAIITTICQIVMYFFLSPESTLLIASVILCVLLVAIIPVVERYLIKNFDEKGKPKES